MKITIMGHGTVGHTLSTYLSTQGKHELNIYDPPKGETFINTSSDVFFICVPADTLPDGSVDIRLIKESISLCPKNKPIFIRSTVTHLAWDELVKEFAESGEYNICYFPEFLSRSTKHTDIIENSVITNGLVQHNKILSELFPTQNKIMVTAREASIAKYAHNSFGAIKVAFFNLIYDLCEKQQIPTDYDCVRQSVLQSTGYINPQHTKVPGVDGRGFSGPCLPKDIGAFYGTVVKEFGNDSHEAQFIRSVIQYNDYLREKCGPKTISD